MTNWRTSRQTLVLALGAVLFAAGCEETPIVTSADLKPKPSGTQTASAKPPPPPTAVQPPASAEPDASAAPETSASPVTSGSELPSAAPAASGSAAPAAGAAAIPFGDFSGPAVKPAVAKGERSWVVVPVAGAWEAVKITVAPALEATDDSIVVEQAGKRYRVPGAFTARALAPTGLKKGDPVMASVKGSRVFARLVDADSAKAHVRFKFAGLVEVAEVALDDLVKVDGTSFLGAPATLKENRAERSAQIVHLGKDRAWVISGGRAHAVGPADVAVLPAPPTLAKGAAVNAARADVITPGSVLEVLDDGLQYKVKWDGGDETATSTFEWVFARPSAAPAPPSPSR